MNTNTLGYISLVLLNPLNIGNHIKDNIDNKLNGMIRILGKHGNFNGNECGSALWNSVHYIIHSKEPIERIYVKISFNEMFKAYIFQQRTHI
jgi:hypothetical protein